jgi:integrase
MSLWNNHKKQRDEVFPLSEDANTRGMLEVMIGKWRREEVGNARSLSLVLRERFERLLASLKSLRDQLIIELPTLQAFRSGEVSSFRAEWSDFDKGILLVLDSNKQQLFPIPLHPIVAKHIAQYMRETEITKGILLQPLKGAPHVGRKLGSKTLGEGLSIKHIEHIWQEHCKGIGIPLMTARWGRAFFATEWMMGRNRLSKNRRVKKNIDGLKAIMRLDDTESIGHLVAVFLELAE